MKVLFDTNALFPAWLYTAGVCATYLFFDEDDSGDIVILGYFTVTMKNLPFKEAAG